MKIVLLQRGDLRGIYAVGIGMDRHLVEVVCTPPLQGHQFPDIREVNMEHIPIEGHKQIDSRM